MKEIQEFFANLKSTFPTITVWDAIDVILVAFILYSILRLIWNTSARRIAVAIVILLGMTLLTELLNLHALKYLFDRVLQLGFVALVIVFQPELRRLLERLGSKASDVKNLFSPMVGSLQTEAPETIEEVVMACDAMSRERVGALIVFERANSLEQIAATGTRVDGAVTQELIRNIFFPKASLHDGAMIIQNSRILAAGCVLPLSGNRTLSTDLGTRHRAGVGMSENSDAVIVIVSEETGTISVAVDGMLKRHLASQTLQKLLTQELIGEQRERTNVLHIIKRKNRRKGGEDDVGRH